MDWDIQKMIKVSVYYSSVTLCCLCPVASARLSHCVLFYPGAAHQLGGKEGHGSYQDVSHTDDAKGKHQYHTKGCWNTRCGDEFESVEGIASYPSSFCRLPAASARSVSVPLSLCPSLSLSLVLSPFSPNKVNECLESWKRREADLPSGRSSTILAAVKTIWIAVRRGPAIELGAGCPGLTRTRILENDIAGQSWFRTCTGNGMEWNRMKWMGASWWSCQAWFITYVWKRSAPSLTKRPPHCRESASWIKLDWKGSPQHVLVLSIFLSIYLSICFIHYFCICMLWSKEV